GQAHAAGHPAPALRGRVAEAAALGPARVGLGPLPARAEPQRDGGDAPRQRRRVRRAGVASMRASHRITDTMKSLGGPRMTVLARCLLRGLPVPRWGNLRRTAPFSATFGFDRGVPIDRYYLHRFLDANRALIAGRVLEVQHTSYTGRFGTGVTT